MKKNLYFFIRSALKIASPLYVILYVFCKNMNHLLLASYYIGKFDSAGRGVRFYPENSSFTYNKITLGNNVFIGRGASFRAALDIGDDVMFGPFVYITDGRHRYENVGETIQSQGPAKKRKVTIEDDCWIGQGTFIGEGVRVCEGSIIGAMSIVTKDVPPYTINVGNPCKTISYRYTDEELVVHLQKRGRTQAEAEEVVRRRKEAVASLNIKK